MAGDVALGEADVAGAEGRAEDAPVVDLQRGPRRALGGAAEAQPRAVGQREVERAVLEPRQQAQHGAGGGGRGRGQGDGGSGGGGHASFSG